MNSKEVHLIGEAKFYFVHLYIFIQNPSDSLIIFVKGYVIDWRRLQIHHRGLISRFFVCY